MVGAEVEALRTAIKARWSGTRHAKVTRYIGQFFSTTRLATKISGQVQGNHGKYTVSVVLEGEMLLSTCSCYIGKHGNCHHCIALALTFLNSPNAFTELKTRKRNEVRGLDTLPEYLRGITLDSLLHELKSKGISGKAFAESIGMNPRQLSAIRSSELRNRFYNDLGAAKLACLWVLEHINAEGSGDS